MTEVEVKVIRLPHGADLPLPDYQSAQAAGLDLLAAVPADVIILPGQRALVPTGLAIALPPGTKRRCARARVWPRVMASPCSTRPAPSMPTTAARSR